MRVGTDRRAATADVGGILHQWPKLSMCADVHDPRHAFLAWALSRAEGVIAGRTHAAYGVTNIAASMIWICLV
jgi:drug/metabolite transporter superfamily protein YnfA